LLLGIGRGFQALRNAGVISALPLLVGVQAMACAPLWAIYRYGAEGLGWVSEGQTLAEGVRVRYPVRGDAVLKVVEESGGQFVAVEEANVLPGRDQLAARGFYVETTSAIVWDGLSQVVSELSEPVVVILTGSGFKSRV
jgi:threonine synthase